MTYAILHAETWKLVKATTSFWTPYAQSVFQTGKLWNNYVTLDVKPILSCGMQDCAKAVRNTELTELFSFVCLGIHVPPCFQG